MPAQGLSHKAPVTRSSSTPLTARLYTQALTVAGVVPTNTEIATALAAAYTAASTTPVAGDVINLTVSGACKIRSTVAATGTASGVWVVAFTVSSVTYYGHQVQTGLY